MKKSFDLLTERDPVQFMLQFVGELKTGKIYPERTEYNKLALSILRAIAFDCSQSSRCTECIDACKKMQKSWKFQDLCRKFDVSYPRTKEEILHGFKSEEDMISDCSSYFLYVNPALKIMAVKFALAVVDCQFGFTASITGWDWKLRVA